MKTQRHRLVAHPDTPAKAIPWVEAALERADGIWTVTFDVGNASALRIPPPEARERTDGLWQHLCFELFIRPDDADDYLEFNLSPSGQWAAYRFDRYREGMRDLPLDPAPDIDGLLRARIDLTSWPLGRCRVALSAVIEEVDGTKSYWALAHPAGKPDFHDDACFALEVPAAETP